MCELLWDGLLLPEKQSQNFNRGTLFGALSAEVHGEGIFAQILPAFFHNPSFH